MATNFNLPISINLLHIIFVSVALIYIGYYKNLASNEGYYMIIALAILAFIYHFYRLFKETNKDKLINYMHLLFVVPLFAYIGYYKNDLSKTFYNFILYLGIGVGLYHIYLFQDKYFIPTETKAKFY